MAVFILEGAYTEVGKWRASNGGSGILQGNITVTHDAGALRFCSQDDHAMLTEPISCKSEQVSFKGSGGGTTSSGMIYIGEQTIILEYVANVRGREEKNTDMWMFNGEAVTRAGIIRQSQHDIWFEAKMIRSSPDL
jgi:hypothetical protein